MQLFLDLQEGERKCGLDLLKSQQMMKKLQKNIYQNITTKYGVIRIIKERKIKMLEILEAYNDWRSENEDNKEPQTIIKNLLEYDIYKIIAK